MTRFGFKARASCEKYSDEAITAAIKTKGREAQSWGLIEHYLNEQQRRDEAVAQERAAVNIRIEADKEKYRELKARVEQEAQA